MDRSKEERRGRGRGAGDEKAGKCQNQTEARGGGACKGTVCKGFLYYSSALKSNGNNPRCIGIPHTVHRVPSDIIKDYEIVSSARGLGPKDFYYACAGNSVYLIKDQSMDKQVTTSQLPLCLGLEFIADKRTAVLLDQRKRVHIADSASAPARVHGKEDGQERPQAQTRKPADSAGDDFLRRYTRNASLVAAGVARNIQKVGNRIKESMDDIMFPNRKRPK
ncbi:hypothetical protein JCGZ_06494 [Jatropha curcas]|uniref:DUF8204 domain-containing protein n=1 Tax=Jatropha curcas TaxID=180498 RepID=A0A067LE46_JATCU|nr:hypothetical protein JCGZ_06494 [Jatropha curcas]